MVQLSAIIAHADAGDVVAVEGYQCVEMTVLTVGALYQSGHHVFKLVERMVVAGEVLAALVVHGHHDESGYLARL